VETIENAYEGTKETLENVYEGTKETLENAYEGTKETLSQLKMQAHNNALKAWEALSDYTSETYDGALNTFESAWLKYQEAKSSAKAKWNIEKSTEKFKAAKEKLAEIRESWKTLKNEAPGSEIYYNQLDLLQQSEDAALAAYNEERDKINSLFEKEQVGIESDYESAAKFLQTATERANVLVNNVNFKAHKNYERIKQKLNEIFEGIRNNFIGTFKGTMESRTEMSDFYKTALDIAQQQLDLAQEIANEAQRNLEKFLQTTPAYSNSTLLRRLEETKEHAAERVHEAQHHLDNWKKKYDFYDDSNWEKFKSRYHKFSQMIKDEL